ncbi:hypothetical protein FHS19_002554 [Paenibacillus rhizosphaerae]|uniref:CobQ/CobB/MinD/ParA nucleotide binding domain-containing protein n=1 Tax=Paenibacillus rhizosphaerae TaxID=297318 RepID=A0A839TQD5_9BACL|nr:hypothetical protein [Paenibacillus rhizosphaerae]MBB3127900.1 hypothetical protein [Paenibacillus rhizosphaerae]
MSTVAFWSPLEGGSGSSAHAAASAACLGLEYRLRVLLGHGGTAGERVEGAFRSSRLVLDHSLVSFHDHGMDALERLAVNRRLIRDNFRDYTIPVLPERLDFVQGNDRRGGTLPGYRAQSVQSIVTIANQCYDLVLLDAGCGIGAAEDPADGTMLEQADLIVVSLTQSIQGLEHFFSGRHYPDQLKDKPVILVLGRYDKESHCTLHNIKRRFGYKGILHGVPYNTDFMDAWNMHGVMNYMQRSRSLNERHPSAQFYGSIRQLAKDLMNMLEIPALKMVGRGA